MPAVQIVGRDAMTAGHGFVDWLDGDRWAQLAVHRRDDGKVGVSKTTADTTAAFVLPREVAQFLILDLQEALKPTAVPDHGSVAA